MRVLQLIDSLSAGGAERMAVAYANELLDHVDASHLCTTRKEGLLKATLNDRVGYLFLKKKRTVDLKALKLLVKYVSLNEIDVIHAHSSSFFYAAVVKLFNKQVKIIWHDHYGENEMLASRSYSTLRKASKYFYAIISVNENLRMWAIEHLKCKNVNYLKNFVSNSVALKPDINLEAEGTFRIVCLANIRKQKDHLNLLSAYELIKSKQPQVSLHLLGEIHHDAYYRSLTTFITQRNLKDVYFYGSQNGVINLLKTCDLGVLSSASEGLPVALLEYGMAQLPVVCTNVGQCKDVINEYGKLVPSNDHVKLSEAILNYVENAVLRNSDAARYSEYIAEGYSFDAVLPKILNIYKKGNY